MLNGRNPVFFGLIALLVLSVYSAAGACTVTLDITGDYVAKGGVVFGSIEVSDTDQGTVTLTTNYTGTGRVIIWNFNFTQVVTTVNVTDCPVLLWVQGTTESSAISDVTITATLEVGGQTKDTDSDTVTIVKVDKVQYQSGANWVDISGTLYVMQGTTVTFKAIPAPAAASWPSGKPVWGGTAGATGTGSTKAVTFNTKSTNATDFKTVTAECGNTVTVNVVVYELTGHHIAVDWFTGRATTKYGVGEIANISFTVDPSGVTAVQMGGLDWSKHAGGGQVNDDDTSGTGTYTAPDTSSSVTLRLTVKSGPSKDRYVDMAFTVTPPTGYNFEKIGALGQKVRHDQGHASCGIRAYVYFRPKDVSFGKMKWGECTCNSQTDGWYSHKFPQGLTHDPNGPWDVGNGDIAKGSRAVPPDRPWSGHMDPPPDHANGTFLWPIPQRYKVGTGNWHNIGAGSAGHSEVIDANGKLTISKEDAGPESKNLNDPDSSWD